MKLKEPIEVLRRFFAGYPDVGAVVCDFMGSGDSGQIEEVRAAKSYSLDEGEGESIEAALIETDREAARDIAYAALEKQGVDWYNNDGGQGEVAIMRNGGIICRTEQNYVETSTYNAEFLMGQDGVEAAKETV